MRRFVARPLVAVALAGTLAIGGCALEFDTTTLGVPVTMAAPAGQPAAGQHFKVSSGALFAFWGLARIRQPSLERALATQLIGGKGVADLRIRTHSSFGGVLVTLLTAGLVVPRTVTFEGTVTNGPEAPSGVAPAAPPR
jgi:hypothetical protein